jgi:hypothetical protein
MRIAALIGVYRVYKVRQDRAVDDLNRNVNSASGFVGRFFMAEDSLTGQMQPSRKWSG